MKFVVSAFVALAGFCQMVQAQPVTDGPYVRYQQGDTALQASWICQGQLQQRPWQPDQPLRPLCGYAQEIRLQDADRRQQQAALPAWQFQARRLAAISDIHGQYPLMMKLLQAAGVVNAAGHWQFADGHLVVVGDVMDRGNGVTAALWQLYQLQREATAAGGRLHFLPGNHETMVLRGDLRYLHNDYRQVGELTGQSQQQLYDEHSVLGQWLRRQPLFVRLNDTLFVHGGLSPQLGKLDFTPEQLQSAYRDSLGKSRQQLTDHALQAFLQGSEGPLWYRGQFRKQSDFSAAGLAVLLQRFGAKRLVLGHTTMDQIYQHHQGLILSTDSDIKKGQQGEVLHFANGEWFKTGLDGQKRPLTDGSAQYKQ